jgi:7,8-dihydro-6-hydroxymethylpterin-pyrophosphokinase
MLSWGLLAIVADLAKGEAAQKKLITQVREFCQILAISSVYKRERTVGAKNPELVAVLKITSSLPSEELAERFSKMQLNDSGMTAEVVLLTLNHEVWLRPDCTLPDLRLAKDPLFLRCAAEAWGDYEHPILGRTLTELVKLHPAADSIEFFAQGTYLG